MDDKEKKVALKEKLRIATGFYELYNSKNFQEFFLPQLKKLATVEYVDPSKFDKKEDYLFKLETANKEAGTYKQLLTFFESQEGVMKRIQAEINKPQVSYGV